MKWLKQVALDLLVFGMVLLTAFQTVPGLDIFLAIYTVLLLFLKVFGLLHEGVLRRMKNRAVRVPDWFYHLLYMLNVAALCVSQRWELGLLWGVIWILSWQTSRKLRTFPQPAVAKKR